MELVKIVLHILNLTLVQKDILEKSKKEISTHPYVRSDKRIGPHNIDVIGAFEVVYLEMVR